MISNRLGEALYLAATRPALFLGVPLTLAGLFMMSAGFIIVIVQNPLYEVVSLMVRSASCCVRDLMLPVWFCWRLVVDWTTQNMPGVTKANEILRKASA